ncbi:hypothetical protein PoB_002323800 [Plakobranchus ocellatus]|uniref:Uncharacterized protein n=1 Tax=Plakobranchus ocellatus TaxID=259542 RepID=A0AAV3ZQ96_9GAST|nr:hypothetical protein PoB_002323800 [Plakobranchus ocellatus]
MVADMLTNQIAAREMISRPNHSPDAVYFTKENKAKIIHLPTALPHSTTLCRLPVPTRVQVLPAVGGELRALLAQPHIARRCGFEPSHPRSGLREGLKVRDHLPVNDYTQKTKSGFYFRSASKDFPILVKPTKATVRSQCLRQAMARVYRIVDGMGSCASFHGVLITYLWICLPRLRVITVSRRFPPTCSLTRRFAQNARAFRASTVNGNVLNKVENPNLFTAS